MTKKLNLTVSLEQAETISQALEIMARLGMGQFTYIRELIADGLILPAVGADGVMKPADRDQIETADDHMGAIARNMGFSGNGSRSIGNAANPKPIREAWEIKKVIDQELAMEQNPNPSSRSVKYDGLTYRITDGPAPVAVIQGGERSEIILLNDLPVIIDAPGDYTTRDGSRVTIRVIEGNGTFSAKGSIWKEFRGKMAPRDYQMWHPSGRFIPLDVDARDIVGKWMGD